MPPHAGLALLGAAAAADAAAAAAAATAATDAAAVCASRFVIILVGDSPTAQHLAHARHVMTRRESEPATHILGAHSLTRICRMVKPPGCLIRMDPTGCLIWMGPRRPRRPSVAMRS